MQKAIDVHTEVVHTVGMKNITVSAEEAVLNQARRRAKTEHRTLNELFRQWLDQYVAQAAAGENYAALMQRLDHVAAGRRFSREEMHARR
jgi:hypothetical protein